MQHVWRCQHPEVRSLWTTTLSNLRSWLEIQNSDPALIDILLTFLDSWRNDLPRPDAHPNYIDLIQSQQDIGWNEVFVGGFSLKWAEFQQEYLSRNRSRCSGRRWLIALIKKLWDVSWDLWAHRNGVAHNHAQHLPDSDIQQLNHSVSRTYQDLVQCGTSRPIRQLTFLPLRKILAKNVCYKTVWLRQAISAAINTRNGARRSLFRMQRCLKAWLRRSRNITFT
jgi:hypothetical protein